MTNRKDLDEAGRVGGNYSLMPLLGLRPEVTNQSKHQAANFGNLYTHLGAERCGAGFQLGSAEGDGLGARQMVPDSTGTSVSPDSVRPVKSEPTRTSTVPVMRESVSTVASFR